MSEERMNHQNQATIIGSMTVSRGNNNCSYIRQWAILERNWETNNSFLTRADWTKSVSGGIAILLPPKLAKSRVIYEWTSALNFPAFHCYVSESDLDCPYSFLKIGVVPEAISRNMFLNYISYSSALNRDSLSKGDNGKYVRYCSMKRICLIHWFPANFRR